MNGYYIWLTDKNVQCKHSVFPNLRKPKAIDFKSIFMLDFYLLIRSTANFNSTVKILSSGHFFEKDQISTLKLT